MTSPASLRPLSVGQVLDRAIRIYRRRLLPFTLIALVLIGPSLLIELIIPRPTIANLLSSTVSLVLTSLVSGMLTSAAAAVYRGEPILRDGVLADGRRCYWNVLVASILVGLIIILPSAVIGGVLAAVLSTTLPSGATVAVAVVVVLPIILFFGARYSATFPAIVIEGRGASDAMSRSWELGKGRFWRIVATYGAAALLALLISMLPSIGYGALSGAVGSPGGLASGPVTSLLSSLGQLISRPLQAIVAVVLYYDLRVRKEGYALEQAIEQLAAEPDTAA